jgi:hypothetical protein
LTTLSIFSRRLLKVVLIEAYCWSLISARTVERAFARFDLKHL